jgi:hypothetical protein
LRAGFNARLVEARDSAGAALTADPAVLDVAVSAAVRDQVLRSSISALPFAVF